MMNQRYDQSRSSRFNGREGRDPWDHTRMPYRRPNNRSPLPVYPGAENVPGRGGCRCNLPMAPVGRGAVPETVSGRSMAPTAADRAAGHSGCGCGSHGSNHHDETAGGCGCGHAHGGCDGHRNKLAEKIQSVDFSLYEVILYLDVYPHSCDALETYHKLKAQREALHAEYEKTYGPLTPFGNQSHTSWDWFDGPFPWEYDAE